MKINTDDDDYMVARKAGRGRKEKTGYAVDAAMKSMMIKQKKASAFGKAAFDPAKMAVEYGIKGARGKEILMKQKKQEVGFLKGVTQKLGQAFGPSAKVERKGKQFAVAQDFQKFKYKATPTGVAYVGAETIVPKGFKKTDHKIVSVDTKTYARDYDKDKKTYIRKGKERTKWGSADIDYAKYNPVEVQLDDQGNIKKIIKRGDFQSYYKRTPTSKDKNRAVYIKEETIFKNNLPYQTKVYDIKKTYDREWADGSQKRKSEPYLKQVVDYGERQVRGYRAPRAKIGGYGIGYEDWMTAREAARAPKIKTPISPVAVSLEELGPRITKVPTVKKFEVSDVYKRVSTKEYGAPRAPTYAEKMGYGPLLSKVQPTVTTTTMPSFLAPKVEERVEVSPTLKYTPLLGGLLR